MCTLNRPTTCKTSITLVVAASYQFFTITTNETWLEKCKMYFVTCSDYTYQQKTYTLVYAHSVMTFLTNYDYRMLHVSIERLFFNNPKYMMGKRRVFINA